MGQQNQLISGIMENLGQKKGVDDYDKQVSMLKALESKFQEVQMFGLEARIFQHEYDHMEGTNFTNHVSKLKLDMAQKRLSKATKRSLKFVDS